MNDKEILVLCTAAYTLLWMFLIVEVLGGDFDENI